MEQKDFIQIVLMGLLHVLTATAAAEFPPCDNSNNTKKVKVIIKNDSAIKRTKVRIPER